VLEIIFLSEMTSYIYIHDIYAIFKYPGNVLERSYLFAVQTCANTDLQRQFILENLNKKLKVSVSLNNDCQGHIIPFFLYKSVCSGLVLKIAFNKAS
jgi:hypothetical protein